jgi:hypothetical protein
MFAILLCLSILSHFTTILAESIYAPADIVAGTPFEATLDVEVHNGDAAYCHAFRVYLASSAEDQTDPFFYDADCMLLAHSLLSLLTKTVEATFSMSKRSVTLLSRLPMTMSCTGTPPLI